MWDKDDPKSKWFHLALMLVVACLIFKLGMLVGEFRIVKSMVVGGEHQPKMLFRTGEDGMGNRFFTKRVMPDDRSRPTRPPERAKPPPLPRRDEDSPPGQYRAPPSRPSNPEPIARIALRAKPPPSTDPHEAFLRALASTEGRMLAEISDQREDFEAQIRKEIQALVIREVKSIPPPAPKIELIPTKIPRFELSSLQYVAALVVALTGLLALILNAQKPNAEITKRLDAIAASQLKANQKLDAHIQAEQKQRSDDRMEDYKYKLDTRSWIADVLERAASVKIDDPPGTPARNQLDFYPPPRIDPHRVTTTHIVQPMDPYPVPPPP